MSIVFENAVKRDFTPFRNDVVGSFLRPKKLKEAREKFAKGEITHEELKKIEDEEITLLVEKEKAAGLKAVTDGEFRRSWWHLDFMWGLDGVEKVVVKNGYQFHGVETRAETARLTGKIGCTNHPFLEHYKFLKSVAGDAIARQTIPAPAQFLAELLRPENKETVDAVYASIDELVSDIGKAYRTFVKQIYDLGCRSLQLDDCTWGMLCDKSFTKLYENVGIDVEDMAKLYAKADNEAIKDHPKDMTITMHVCRGNYSSTWAASGGYEPVAEVLFKTVNVDGFYLEFDTDRAGDFSPLRFVEGKQVVLGLISSKIGELENSEDVKKRIKEATKYLDINQICLSPQCGFASTEEGNVLTEEQQWNKLRFIKEIADEIWK